MSTPRPRSPRSTFGLYLPLLVAAALTLIIVGLRTDGRVGRRGAELAESIDRDGTSSTPTTDASDETDDTGPPPTLPSTTTVPTVDDPDDAPETLRRAQLTEADLPDGWAPSSLGDRSTAVCPGNDPAAEVDPESSLKASFVGGEEGPYLTSIVAEFDGDGEAEDYLDALGEAIDACASYEDEDSGTTYTVERTRGSDLGDQSVTAGVTADGPLGDVRGRILSVRVDDRVVTIVFYSVGDSDASVAVEALEEVVARL